MSTKNSILFSTEPRSADQRMVLERMLIPHRSHPLVCDLLESIRDANFGQAHLALALIRKTLEISDDDLQNELAHLLFLNAVHSFAPFEAFDFLADCGFSSEQCSTELAEHLAFSPTSSKKQALAMIFWLFEHGAIVRQESKAAIKSLQAEFPEAFLANVSRHEAISLASALPAAPAAHPGESCRL